MSFSTYVSLKAKDECPLVAIPVMLSKMFRHDCIYVRRDAGISSPRDLMGKRIGVMRYSSTGVVYIKGLLEHDFGVAARQLRWVIGGLEEPMRSARPPDAPPDVEISIAGERETLVSLLAKGELDALISLYLPSTFVCGESHIVRLFPSFRQAEIDYYERTKIFPIMHVVAIRRESYLAEPWIASRLYEAFVRAKEIATAGLYDTDALHLTLPFLIDDLEEARKLFGSDYYAYGLEANRMSVLALCQYAFEQNLTPRLLSPDELFVNVSSTD
jgi:4,5-dihydroxyphthalate decarboxylase